MSGSAVKAMIDAAEVFEAEEAVEEFISRLAALSPLEYDLIRRAEADGHGVRVSTLDDEVSRARRSVEGSSASAVMFDDPEPWPQAVDGAELLDRLTAKLKAHLVLPPGAAEVVALWILLSHAHDSFDISPTLAITSPAPECGKTTLLTIAGALVPRALPASNVTPAALFRSIDKWEPTLLIDEADTFLPGNEDLRGILNSGHHRATAFVLRTTGDDHEPRPFATWAPKAVALIGKLPPTLSSRSIHIELRRMTATEKVDPLRPDRLTHLKSLKSQAARWASDNSERLRSADPDMPAALYARAADNWRPLIAIADLAGGHWPAIARGIAEVLGGRRNAEVAGITLLDDVRCMFAERGVDRIFSEELAVALGQMEDRPWSEWRNGRPITKAQIARILRPFGVQPGTIRIGSQTGKGYPLALFADPFARYLEAEPVTPSQPAESLDFDEVTVRHSAADVTDAIPPTPAEPARCDGVTAEGEEPWEDLV